MGEIPLIFPIQMPISSCRVSQRHRFFYNLRLREHRAGFIGFPETQSFNRTRLRNKQYMCYDEIVNDRSGPFLISRVSNKTLCLRKTKNEPLRALCISILKKKTLLQMLDDSFCS